MTSVDRGVHRAERLVIAGVRSSNAALPARGETFKALIETTKPGIVRLVTITAMVGFALAAIARPWNTLDLALTGVLTLLGTALSAAGANAINQWMERERDSLMARTQKRPLPQGRLQPKAALTLGITLSALGVGLLLFLHTWVPAALALACVLVYVFAYTPLKLLTPWSTYVGTIPGALPPLIGWTAASATPGMGAALEPLGLALVVIMLIWQMPHSLALAWLYRDDYAKGGYRLFPVLESTGTQTAWHIALWTILLVPATLAPALLPPRPVGAVYVLIALATGAAFVHAAWKLIRVRDRAAAKRLFIVSIIQLPLLFVGLVGEAMLRLALA